MRKPTSATPNSAFAAALEISKVNEAVNPPLTTTELAGTAGATAPPTTGAWPAHPASTDAARSAATIRWQGCIGRGVRGREATIVGATMPRRRPPHGARNAKAPRDRPGEEGRVRPHAHRQVLHEIARDRGALRRQDRDLRRLHASARDLRRQPGDRLPARV